MQGNSPTSPKTSTAAGRSEPSSASSPESSHLRDYLPELPEALEGPLEQGAAYVRQCVRAHPEAAALWCLGIGFVLGWKLKPW